jgi:hypothetical protein
MFPIRGLSYQAHFFSPTHQAVYKGSRSRAGSAFSTVMATQFTHSDLRKYDGKGPSGKIYVAVQGKVYDVTDKGKEFYGPGVYH